MGKLTIIGDIAQLKIIAKSESGRARKYNLVMSIENKNQEDASSPGNDDPRFTAVQVSELIDKCESLEDLLKYESDKRQVVVRSYEKKLKEFE